MLNSLCAVAFFSSLSLALYVAPRVALFTLWASWLSLVSICHPWLDFQWDLLLVEASFVSWFFAPSGLSPRAARHAPEPSKAARFMLRWLAFKLTFESGVVKLASGDPTWRDLTALTYHWWTQPLPTWSSFLANALPYSVQLVLCALMFVFELPLPLLALGPRTARLISAAGLMMLQAALFAAGNYSYYNLLTFVLAVPLLDDQALAWLTRRPLPTADSAPPSRWPDGFFAVLFALLSVLAFERRLTTHPHLEAVQKPLRAFDTINAYGAFAVMTKTRTEILIEGSDDGVTWQRYEFPYKAGDVHRRPTFVAPWQPRLDWQLWFAALGSCSDSPWMLSLQRHLLLGTPSVLSLFEKIPFPEHAPKFVRTRNFEYTFAPLSDPNGWWVATEAGPFCPPLRLGPVDQLERADRF